MAISALTTQLPTLAGALPDLFRRPDAGPRGVDGTTARPDGGATDSADGTPARTAGTDDDISRMLARRAALGPLTYGRRMAPADAPAAAPAGLRGVHLDVRG
ncbi:MAG: hypothetical protein IT355_05440 [Gemmatimonadaceae bacterium]|nr:hypothetical protein [Gemmatimonadaceae bacterium]